MFKIRSFLGLTGYYQCFIEGFSKLLGPLTALTKKNAYYVWTNECEKSFQELKRRLIIAPMLALPIGSSNFIVYSDTSKKRMCDHAKRQYFCLHFMPTEGLLLCKFL